MVWATRWVTVKGCVHTKRHKLNYVTSVFMPESDERSSLQYRSAQKVRRIVIPSSTTVPTRWFRWPPSLLSPYSGELAAASLAPPSVLGACQPTEVALDPLTYFRLSVGQFDDRITNNNSHDNIVVANNVEQFFAGNTRPA